MKKTDAFRREFRWWGGHSADITQTVAFDLILNLKLQAKGSTLGLTKQLQVFSVDSVFCWFLCLLLHDKR